MRERLLIMGRIRAEKLNLENASKHGSPIVHAYKEGWIEALEWVWKIST